MGEASDRLPTSPAATATRLDDDGPSGLRSWPSRGVSKRFGATQALEDVSLTLQAGRDPRAARRERRRQVDADQDHDRRPATGHRGDAVDGGEVGPRGALQDAQRSRRRGDLPGAEDLPGPVGRREHLHRPSRSWPGRSTARRMRREAERDARPARRPARRGRAGARPDAGGAADRRDRQGPLARGARADHGRADGVALRPRGAAAVRDRRLPAAGGRRDPVHLAPDGRGLRDRRPRHDPPRRPLDLDPTARGPDPGVAIREMVGRDVQRVLPADSGASRARSSSRSAASGAKGRSGRLVRACARARCSASPVSSGRAGPTSGWPCSGSRRPTAATIALDGRVTSRSATRRTPCGCGIAYSTEDRRQLGLVFPLSIAANISLPSLARYLIASGWSSAGRGARPRNATASGCGIRAPSVRVPGRHALGRQPAEGRPQQVAGDETAAC